MFVRRGSRRPVLPLAASACLALVALVGLVTLAACSNRQTVPQKRPHTGSGTASVVAGVQQVTIDAGADLRFHPSTITVHPGKVRVVLRNTASSGPPHNLQVGGLPGAFVPLTTGGRTQAATFVAPKPGRYRFVCTIHETQGQTGTLIVRAGSS